MYEAHYGMTQEWAAQLVGLGYNPDLALSYDRFSGAVDYKLGDLAGAAPGTIHETFHFVLNNTVAKDNRIPPYGMNYEAARQRNALPVPADQYGNPGSGGVYNYWDIVTLTPPAGAVYATIDLLYQPTSWEYIQFLWLANNGQNAFLADEGVNLLEAWLNNGMAQPYVMASTTWGSAPVPATPKMWLNSLTTWSVGKRGVFETEASVFKSGDTVGFRTVVQDEDGNLLSGAQVFIDITDSGGGTVTSIQGFSDETGTADLTWKTGRREAAGTYTAVVNRVIKNGFEYDPAAGVTSVPFDIQ